MAAVTRKHSDNIRRLREISPVTEDLYQLRRKGKKYQDPIAATIEGSADIAGLPNRGDPEFDPVLPTPIPMPDPSPTSQASIAARRRSIQAQALRRGRMSTILSQAQSEPLGA